MLFYVDTKTNKVYIEISNQFFGVDICSQGVKPLEDEVYNSIEYDLVCEPYEIKARYGINEDSEYKFPVERKAKKTIVKEEPKEEVEEKVEEPKKEKISKKK